MSKNPVREGVGEDAYAKKQLVMNPSDAGVVRLPPPPGYVPPTVLKKLKKVVAAATREGKEGTKSANNSDLSAASLEEDRCSQ